MNCNCSNDDHFCSFAEWQYVMGKNLELKSDVVELLPCVPHPQNKVHRPLVLRDARLGLRQRDLGINMN